MPRSKKYIYGSVLTLVVAGLLFYIGFIPKTYRQKVSVPYPMLRAGEQFNNPGALVKWFLPFAGNDSLKKSLQNKKSGIVSSGDYSIEVIDPATISAIVKTGYKNTYNEFIFSAVSDSADMDACNIYLTYQRSLLSHWLDKGGLEKKARESLENLKTYMEDTRQFYGYEIEQTTVTDTSFIFLSATVPVAEKRTATKDLFTRLIDYARQKDAGYNGTRIFYTVPFGKDQAMLFASIGVNNRVITGPGEPVQYKRMPFGKNLLLAVYQGPYGEISKAYTALENFKADHKLSSMAIPYQKFLTEGFDFSDSQIVQMKVYYPIF